MYIGRVSGSGENESSNWLEVLAGTGESADVSIGVDEVSAELSRGSEVSRVLSSSGSVAAWTCGSAISEGIAVLVVSRVSVPGTIVAETDISAGCGSSVIVVEGVEWDDNVGVVSAEDCSIPEMSCPVGVVEKSSVEVLLISRPSVEFRSLGVATGTAGGQNKSGQKCAM